MKYVIQWNEIAVLVSLLVSMQYLAWLTCVYFKLVSMQYLAWFTCVYFKLVSMQYLAWFCCVYLKTTPVKRGMLIGLGF